MRNEGGNNNEEKKTRIQNTPAAATDTAELKFKQRTLEIVADVVGMVLRLIMDYFENNSMRIFEWCECRLCNLLNGFLANMWNVQ